MEGPHQCHLPAAKPKHTYARVHSTTSRRYDIDFYWFEPYLSSLKFEDGKTGEGIYYSGEGLPFFKFFSENALQEYGIVRRMKLLV
jgi:hypothetical protein